MPRLLLFAPCEKVIIAQGENSPTLIALMQELVVYGVAEQPPPNAVITQRWAMFSLWRKEPSDNTDAFEQRITLKDPSGRSLLDHISRFQMVKTNHRHTINVINFPVGAQGEHLIEVFIREQGRDDWANVTSYPLMVHYSASPPQIVTPSST